MTDEKKIAEIQSSARKKARTRKYFSVFLITVTVIFFLVIAFNSLFDIKEVRVEGISPAVPYSAEDIIEFLNVGDNTNLITYDRRRAQRSLLYQFPYIEEIEVNKKFPSAIEVVITENKGTQYINIGDDVFILSSGGRVLEIVDDPFYDGKNRMQLVSPDVKRCVCGEDIVFERSETISIMSNITEQLDKYELTEKMTCLDITDKFDVRLMYDNRFEIRLGTFENPDVKIKLFSAMIKNKSWDDFTGIIDISSGSEAEVRFTGNVAN